MWLAKTAQKTEGKKRTARNAKKDTNDISVETVVTAPEEDVSVAPMPKKHPIVDDDSDPGRRTPEEDIYDPPRKKKPKTEAGREKQMVALAVDLAEKQLREGTASAQVITHYLKLGTEKEKLERAIMKEQKELISEKTKALRAVKQMEELYSEAIEAMKRYSGGDDT